MARFGRCGRRIVALSFVVLTAVPAGAGSPAETAILPPEIPWQGKSLQLIAPPDHLWITPAEASGFHRTPTYAETVAWLDRLVAASPELSMISIGKSPEGRELWLVIASAERARTPEALAASGKPTLLAQAGIHAGEIDGKDAGLMLLRDIAQGSKKQLLDGANFLFVPIFNVDGHERSSRFGRINQRGPDEMGWRTTSQNLNLNRDYAKADAPEMQAMLGLLNRWNPDLYFDLHVTDGADYQYDITFGHVGAEGYSPAIGAWMSEKLDGALAADLAAAGHIPGPLVFLRDAGDPTRGTFLFNGGPRFSTSYGDLRHLPTLLVENHSLKPYRQRVLGTRVLLESALRTLAREAAGLRAAVGRDRSRRPATLPLQLQLATQPSREIEFLGIESKRYASKISGQEIVTWTGKPMTFRVPVFEATVPASIVPRPAAYWVPASWTEIIARLASHGVRFERIAAPRTLEVEMDRLVDAKLGGQAFEGRVGVSAKTERLRRQETFPPGSVRVPTDQPLGDLAMVLLEPESPDSFFSWGFMHSVLQRTEYAEDYAMAPMAEAMLAADPALEKEFKAALAADPELAKDTGARLDWFYRRTPFWDERWLLYPIARE